MNTYEITKNNVCSWRKKRGQAETLENMNIKGQQLVMTAEKEDVRKTGESDITEAKKKSVKNMGMII